MRQKLSKKQLENISQATFNKCNEIGAKHAQDNLPYIKNTILDLQKEDSNIEHAIVICAGPSLHINNHAETILNAGYKGIVIAADGAMYYCLRKGIIPDYVLTVDPHPTRIIRSFGDPELKSIEDDDYFRRQDLDPALNEDEIKRNQEIVDLVNKYGKKIKMIISTSSSPKITRRCLEAGMQLYWWNPIYDDYEKKGSLTRKIFDMTKIPCMATGGNVGTSAWVFAAAILGVKNVALVGMDFSYHPDTPLYRTQYYHELKEVFKDRIEDGFIKVYNPYLKQRWYTDPAYYWYRQNFLGLVKKVDSNTYNCTEGGILFGKGINFVKLKNFLKRFS